MNTDIKENSYYSHDDHGRVGVEFVGKDTVLFSTDEGEAHAEMVPEFEERTEPADVTVTADTAEYDITGVNQ